VTQGECLALPATRPSAKLVQPERTTCGRCVCTASDLAQEGGVRTDAFAGSPRTGIGQPWQSRTSPSGNPSSAQHRRSYGGSGRDRRHLP
jgi:hypothetical protein